MKILCVCLSVFGGVDQAEVVLETVVTAPNLLNQLPSVLTDAASFLPKGIVMNLSIASLGLFPLRLGACRLSLSVCCVVFFVRSSCM